jgi:bifunctional non-homologous end joining protein LigD
MPTTSRPRRSPSTAAQLPDTLTPELATLVQKPRAGDWLYEIKFDGYRMLTRIASRPASRSDVRIFTRRGNDWTARFPALHAALRSAKLPPGWYDGEIVVLDSAGKPSFNALQNAIDGRANDTIVYYLFDAPFLGGVDMRGAPVEERRAALAAALHETDILRFSQEIDAPVEAIVATACKLGLEGVIGKRRGSHYVHRRSDDWIKLKCVQRQEFVIGGYTWPDASRHDPGLGALLVGQFDGDGALKYSGKVGTGFTAAASADLRARLDAIAQPKRPFAGPTGHDRHAQWVRPQLVCEVTFNEWPEGGSLRHASFKGLREDKAPREVERERPAPAAGGAASSPALRITHAKRIIDASTGLTKGDVARYYAQVAPWMLPHLACRHAYVARFPEGINGVRIFQQHPEGMKGFRGTDPALWPGHDPAIAFESAEDLVGAAQLDVIEIHTWNSTREAILLPDRMIFDLDPGDGVAWPQVREAALLVRAMLQELGLQSWLKTSGGKGLHVVVPIRPELGYAAVKNFSAAVVQHMARTLPERFVGKSGGRNRVGRIFIDFLRNGQSQSTAEAFSVRARPSLPVSMPLAWSELRTLQGPAEWTITNALAHLEARKTDPWASYWRSRQSLREAKDKLP